ISPPAVALSPSRGVVPGLVYLFEQVAICRHSYSARHGLYRDYLRRLAHHLRYRALADPLRPGGLRSLAAVGRRKSTPLPSADGADALQGIDQQWPCGPGNVAA